MKRLLFLTCMVLILMSACSSQQQYNIDSAHPGILRDYIFSVEPAVNGTYAIWLRNDDIAVYCTADKDIGEIALKAVRSKTAMIVMSYRNPLKDDPEYNLWGSGGGCAWRGAKVMCKILSIEILDDTP